MDVNPGQFIKLFAYTGQVRDVFKSNTGRTVAEVLWAKDVARSNPPEFVELGDNVEPGTLQGFSLEIVQIRKGQDDRFNEVLRGE